MALLFAVSQRQCPCCSGSPLLFPSPDTGGQVMAVRGVYLGGYWEGLNPSNLRGGGLRLIFMPRWNSSALHTCASQARHRTLRRREGGKGGAQGGGSAVCCTPRYPPGEPPGTIEQQRLWMSCHRVLASQHCPLGQHHHQQQQQQQHDTEL